MQYARITANSVHNDASGDSANHAQFALRQSAGHPWVPLDSLGLAPADTAELIELADVASVLMDADRGKPTEGDVMLCCPVVRPSKIIAIGLNYRDHIRETHATEPTIPVSFAKYPSSLNDPFGGIIVDPAVTAEPDYEAELAVVIGRPTFSVTTESALSHIFGYAVANDVSARDLQRLDPQLSRSKSLDTFCPIGPWITSADEVPDPQALSIECRVNDEIRQQSTTGEMLFPITELISFLSRTMTLQPGDVILTGTPHGVGMGRNPPAFLETGDVVTVKIGDLGEIRNTVASLGTPNGSP